MPVKSFEPVYKRLNEMFINELPVYIEKENIEHNDGIILHEFENKSLEDKSILFPSFIFCIEESIYNEKYRILENTVFCLSFEILLQPNTENEREVFWRYVEAIDKMIRENEDWQEVNIEKVKGKKIFLKIIL